MYKSWSRLDIETPKQSRSRLNIETQKKKVSVSSRHWDSEEEKAFVGLGSCDNVQTERKIFKYANWPRLQIKKLVCPAGPSSWSVQLVRPAGPYSWFIQLIHIAEPSSWFVLQVLQIACVVNCMYCKLYVLQIACVLNCTCTCYKLHMLHIVCVANCMCCKSSSAN